MITAFSHVGISVSNLERSLAFYRDLLGMRVIQEVPFGGPSYDAIMGVNGTDGRIAVLRTQNLEIELLEFRRPLPRPADPDRRVFDQGLSHFAIHVADIAALRARLEAAGVRFHSALVYFPRCATTAVYFRDPDGNLIEMIQENMPAPREAARGQP
jgi:catechol 2,3-dioxygenase-like lactoylglutathione lyase family enzyme